MRPSFTLSASATCTVLATALCFGLAGPAVAAASPSANNTPIDYPELALGMSQRDVGAKLAEAYGTKSVSLSGCVMNDDDKEPIEVCFVNDERGSFRTLHLPKFVKGRLVASMLSINWTGEGALGAQQQYSALSAKLKKTYGEPHRSSPEEESLLEWKINEREWRSISWKGNSLLIGLSPQSRATKKNDRHPVPGSAFRRAWAYLDPKASDEIALELNKKAVGIASNAVLNTLSPSRTASTTHTTSVPGAFSALKLNMSIEETGRRLTGVYGLTALRDIECVRRVKGKTTLETCTLLSGLQKIGKARPHATQILIFENDALIGSHLLMNTASTAAVTLNKQQVSGVVAGLTAQYGPGRSAELLGDAIYSWSMPRDQQLIATHLDGLLTLSMLEKTRATKVAAHDWSQISPTVRQPWAANPLEQSARTK
jgi:hypothetical protein